MCCIHVPLLPSFCLASRAWRKKTVLKWVWRAAVDSLAGGQWRGCGVEGHTFMTGTDLVCVAGGSRKERQSRDSATKQSVILYVVVHPFHSSSPLSISLPPPPFLSLIGAHSLVFHHTYPHLNFTNPIYCYLYPWLLLSLLLLLLLLWLELLSLRAIFSFYFHGFKYWFAELGGCLDNKRH